MNLRNKQRGMGMWMSMYVLVTLAFSGYLGLKVVPLYLEGMKVDSAIAAVAADASMLGKRKLLIAEAIVRRLDVDGEYRINDRNYGDYIKISSNKKRLKIDANYAVQLPIFANLSVTAAFSYSASSSGS